MDYDWQLYATRFQDCCLNSLLSMKLRSVRRTKFAIICDHFFLRPSDPLTHFATLRESCYSFCGQSPTSHHKCKWLVYYNTDLLLFICIWDFSVSLLTWYLHLNQFSIDLLWLYFFICFVQIYLMPNAILYASLKNNTETDCG